MINLMYMFLPMLQHDCACHQVRAVLWQEVILGWLECVQGFREHEEDMQFKPSRMCGMLLTL
jgi:hypothetical protein